MFGINVSASDLEELAVLVQSRIEFINEAVAEYGWDSGYATEMGSLIRIQEKLAAA